MYYILYPADYPQPLGSGKFTGIRVDVRERNESPVIISITKYEFITTMVLQSVQPLTDYVLTFYVISTVGKSPPYLIKASTNFKSKLF